VQAPWRRVEEKSTERGERLRRAIACKRPSALGGRECKRARGECKRESDSVQATESESLALFSSDLEASVAATRDKPRGVLQP
jgi:hypothetical protein